MVKRLINILLLFVFLPVASALTISGPTVPNQWITDETAIVMWETDSYANISIDYGLTSSYGLSVSRNEFSRTHIFDLGNLQASSLYHYRITATDKQGMITTTNDLTFSTTSEPTIIDIPGQYLSSPMTLSQSNVKYRLTGDVSAESSAFRITGSNVVFDLNGHTINYDTYQSMSQSLDIPNGDFETGDFTGWTVSPSDGWYIEGDDIRPFEGKWHIVMKEPPSNGAQIISPWAYAPTNTEMIAGFFSDSKAGDWNAHTAADCPSVGCPRIRFEVERDDGTIVKSWDDTFYWGRKNSFNTNSDTVPRRYRIKYTLVQWNGPANVYHKDAAYDSFQILPRNNYAIDVTGNNVEIKNGIVIQGRGKSIEGHAIRIRGDNDIVRKVTINVFGNEAKAIYSTGTDNLISENIITSTAKVKYNRNILGGPITLQYGRRNLVYNNQITSGSDSAKPWNAIHVDNSNGVTTNEDIAYNTINIKTTLTNHHAITCWMCDNTRVFNNKITADPGQGILFSGDPPAMINAKIYDNQIVILSQEPNEENGIYSQDAIRLNDYQGNGCDAWIDGNNITVYGDFNDYYRTGHQGVQVANGIITGCSSGSAIVSNNTIKAIRIDNTGVLVSSIEPIGGVGASITYENNYLQSNNNIITFGGYKKYNDGVILKNNTLIKDANPISFNTIYSRSRPHVNGVRFIDTNFLGGAVLDTTSIFLDSIDPNYEFFSDYTLNLNVLDSSSSPVPGARVVIKDNKGNTVLDTISDSLGKITTVLNRKRFYGPSSTPNIELNTPHTIEITASGFEPYTQSVNMDSKKDVNAYLISSGPGILLHSTMDSLSEIANPTINTGTTNPSTLGTIDLVTSPYGGGVQIHGTSGNEEQIYYNASNFDFSDLAGDGGRIDFKLKFNQDPHRINNSFIIKTDSTFSDGPYRWFVFEMLGNASKGESRPWIVFYCTDASCWNGPRPTFQIFPPHTWNVWQNVQAGEWHNYTILWRNNGPGNAEMHFYIDGQHCGNACSDYGGYMTPPGAFNRLEWGPTINGSSADVSIDEFWSFSRWDHNAGPGTYDETVTVPENVVLLSPQNNELLFTVNPTFDFIATSNIDPASCSGGTQTNNWISWYKETFDGVKTFSDGETFGINNWLTAEIRNNGLLMTDGSGVLNGITNNFPDSVMVRTTNSLPNEYKMRIKIGNVNADWQSYDANDYSDPNFKYNCINPLTSECRHPENGVYWLTPTDIPCDMPGGCNEDWWHQHRKVVIDSDDHLKSLVNPGGCDETHTINSGCEEIEKPLYMVYMQPGAFDSQGNLVDASQLLASWNGSQNWWYTGAWNWEAAIRPYDANTFYWAEIEKSNGQLIFRLYDQNNNLIEETNPVDQNKIHHMGNTASPFEYMYFGEPHINSYEGSFQVDEVELLVKEGSQCQCSVLVDGQPVVSGVALSGERQSLTSLNQLTSGTHNWNVECYNGNLISETRTFSIDPSAVPICTDGSVGSACSSLIDGVTCNGQEVCVGNSWQCIIPPGGCEQNGVGGLWQFQNGLFGYVGQTDLCISNNFGEHDLTLEDCILRTSNVLMKDKLIYFDLSELPPGKIVESATLTLTEKEDGAQAGGIVDVRQLVTDRSLSDATFNCAEDNDHDGNCEKTWIQTGARSDYSNVVSELMAKESTVNFNVTAMVTEWYNNGNNYGFLIKEMEGKLLTIVNATDSPNNLRPLLSIQLRDSVISVNADVNSDGVVNILDVVIAAAAWGSSLGDVNYVAEADLDNSGDIGIGDLIIIANNWGSQSVTGKIGIKDTIN